MTQAVVNVGIVGCGRISGHHCRSVIAADACSLVAVADLEIERHLLPNLLSVNFVIRRLLGEGVAASTRQDGQAKSLGEWLRARVVDVPESLLESA